MYEFSSMPDESLMDFIRGGNVRAFETLVTRHHARFYRMVYRWVLHRQDAEDLVQDAFLKVWSGKARWKSGKNAQFLTWFYRILYHQSVDVLRRRKRSMVELSEDLASNDLSAEEALADRQLQLKLRSVLNQLSDSQRMAVQLFYFEQLPQKHIAKVMGLTVKALESQLHRAKSALKEGMKDYDQARTG